MVLPLNTPSLLRPNPLPRCRFPFFLVAHYFGPAFGVCHSICSDWSLHPALVLDAFYV